MEYRGIHLSLKIAERTKFLLHDLHTVMIKTIRMSSQGGYKYQISQFDSHTVCLHLYKYLFTILNNFLAYTVITIKLQQYFTIGISLTFKHLHKVFYSTFAKRLCQKFLAIHTFEFVLVAFTISLMASFMVIDYQN